MPTDPSRIQVKLELPVARISLRNPPLNVIDIPMMDELANALMEIESRPDISVVLLESSLKDFSVGVDVAAHTPDKVREMLTNFHAVILALIKSTKVSIAAVRGNCLGGGAELAAVCDLVYTSDSTVWGFPEIKLGCYPPVAATMLANLIGPKHAADLILTGRSISGREAAAIGLANGAVPEAEVDSEVKEAVDRLTKLSPAALAVTKKAIYVWDAVHFPKGLARSEQIYLDELMQTEDAAGGVAAFLEKRPPIWKGK